MIHASSQMVIVAADAGTIAKKLHKKSIRQEYSQIG